MKKTKKVFSAAMACVVSVSMLAGFAVSGNAAEKEVEYVIPYVSPAKIPTIDGVSTAGEWDKALVIDVNKDTVGAYYTEQGDEIIPPDDSASLKAYLLWSSDLSAITDPAFAFLYNYNDDPIGGLYFKFEVKDTTKAWANGLWTANKVTGDRNAEQADGVQVIVDPGLRQAFSNAECWKYTFNAYSAGNPGVGSVPSGNAFWWEHWQVTGGSGTYEYYPVQVKSTVHWTYDPAYPMPEGPEPIGAEDPEAWKAYKSKADDAAEHAIAYDGYVIEAFLPWIALNYDGGAGIIPSTTEEFKTKIGMCLNLLDWTFDWQKYKESGNDYNQVQYCWSSNLNKSTAGDNDTSWSAATGRSQNFNVFELGASMGSAGDVMKGDCNGDGDISLADVSLAALHVAGMEVLTGDNFTAADVNGDDSVTLPDVSKIALHVAGIELLD